jgi:hypothetical protein
MIGRLRIADCGLRIADGEPPIEVGIPLRSRAAIGRRPAARPESAVNRRSAVRDPQ